jgi:hypothetical protein
MYHSWVFEHYLASLFLHQFHLQLETLSFQATLSWWGEVSPYSNGIGATLALAFVLIVAAVKAIVEDRKRHLEDHKTNMSKAIILVKDGVPSMARYGW